MRALLVHNYYGSTAPSGENQVFEADRALLQARGHEVEEFVRHSDEIRGRRVSGTLQGALVTPWNLRMARAMRRKVATFKPDVVHVHNTFPLISPAIFHAIGGRAARVLTLHNYRLFCAAAIPMRGGRTCTLCLDRRSVWPAMRYGCYRGSRAATAPLAANVALHRRLGTWRTQVDAFITLSEFQKRVMEDAGLPSQKVHVKPNFYPGSPQPLPWSERGAYALFVGRLSPEKGVETLLRAWLAWGAQAPAVRILGDGPLRPVLERIASKLPAGRVQLVGQVPSVEAKRQIAKASLVLLPSESFEGFPMVVLEAFAFGTPVAVSNLGPLPSIVRHGENGVMFEAHSADSLRRVVCEAWETPGEMERLGLGARRAFEQSYTEDANYEMLMGIYRGAMEASARRDEDAA